MDGEVNAYYLDESKRMVVTIPLPYRAAANLFVSAGRQVVVRGRAPDSQHHFLVEEGTFQKICLDHVGIFPFIERCVFPSVQQAVDHLKELARKRGVPASRITEIEQQAGAAGKSNYDCFCLRARFYMSELGIPPGVVSWREAN